MESALLNQDRIAEEFFLDLHFLILVLGGDYTLGLEVGGAVSRTTAEYSAYQYS